MFNKFSIDPRQQKLIVYISLIIIALAVFWQVTQFDFINFDDNGYVTENSHIQSGITLDGIRWAFGTKYLELWTPLVWLSFMFDYQLYVLNAGGYHLTNLILHILSTLLLFWLFNRMTGAIWKSAFVAAFFAIHPLHVESVVWIAERKDVLSAFFWMLTLCFYVYYTEKPIIKRYFLVLFSFILALMSKPMVVTLPVIMILLDYWPLKRFESKKHHWILWQFKEKTPFFILSAGLLIFTFYTPGNSTIKFFRMGSRFANAIVSFMIYLEKTFWPHDLAVYYPFPVQIPAGEVLGAALLIFVISVAVIIMIKRLPYLFVGWFWYTITILPVIGIIQISLTKYAMADRYHYLPSIGIAVMLAWGIPSLVKSEDLRRKMLFPAAIVFLAILAALSWKQCGYWKNSIEIYSHALRVTQNNYLAHNNRGAAYAELGQYKNAIEDFSETIRLKSNYGAVFAYTNRGLAYSKIGQYKQAFEDFNKAIDLKPDHSDVYYNRGITYFKQGRNKLGCLDARKACELGKCEVLRTAEVDGYCR